MVSVVIIGILFICLIAGFPMVVGMIGSSIAAILIFFPKISMPILMQNLVTGISSSTLLAVPMYILAAEIMCSGKSGEKLFGAVRILLGHLPGGVAVASIGSCTLFGAISGSTQATLVAVGRPMYGQLRKIGYTPSHALAMLASSANIALLIPPSICMIMYAICGKGVSLAELFIAGVVPGILLFVFFSIYEIITARIKHIPRTAKPSAKEVGKTLKEAILPFGFPVLILGGIYAGWFSPTEAAAVAVAYAFILEAIVYRSMKVKEFCKAALSTGVTTATVFILVAAGQVLSFVISYAGIPQSIASAVIESNMGATGFLFVVAACFFVSCMFVDSIPVILILVPIFFPIATSLGINEIHLGVLVTLQAAIGCITPPFGCNIFTASAIFDQSFSTIVKGLWPYVVLFVATTVLIIVFPDISLSLVKTAFGG
ncbi:MAG: TRAP transporter large permease [Oscillospiraceae bacterium]|nr:TRAP transporter large permease [Oscillospiraceae bacterium]